MGRRPDSDETIQEIIRFLHRKRRRHSQPINAVSTFSGCGLSDLGYELAGFEFLAQVEKDETRADIGQENFCYSQWYAYPVDEATNSIAKLAKETRTSVDVLIATPPCQGLSSSNPSRGKRRTEKAWKNSEKNRLILDVLPLVKRLLPRVIVAENVRQVLTHRARNNGRVTTVPDLLRHELSSYDVFTGTINVADYGIPQIRRRAIMVAIHRDETWLDELKARNLLPWPSPTHSENGKNGGHTWVSIKQWLKAMDYEQLSGKSPNESTGSHPLHFVPSYDAERYSLVSSIPKNTGRSAYETDRCPTCKTRNIPQEVAVCPKCGEVLFNRPIVRVNGHARLIKGFNSSYRRMHANRPASTVTTNSSHVGSDNKIHPWEHRVMSALECADLQTVPRLFNWDSALDSGRSYLVRNLIGEAFPPYFTYLHGRLLKRLLQGDSSALASLATQS